MLKEQQRKVYDKNGCWKAIAWKQISQNLWAMYLGKTCDAIHFYYSFLNIYANTIPFRECFAQFLYRADALSWN